MVQSKRLTATASEPITLMQKSDVDDRRSLNCEAGSTSRSGYYTSVKPKASVCTSPSGQRLQALIFQALSPEIVPGIFQFYLPSWFEAEFPVDATHTV